MKPDSPLTGALDGLNQLQAAFGSQLENQLKLGTQLMNVLGSSVGSMLRSTLEQATCRKTKSCCDIPEPCWMPKHLGDITCGVCAGSSGTIRFRVTNENIRPQAVTGMASGPDAAQVKFTPPTLNLGPKERGVIAATFTLPANAKDGESREAILWIRGCRDYYLRWTITAGKKGQDCCEEIEICDGPDNILHWYDHFYCPRPCHSGRTG
jgi:hypothetical protein